MKNDTDLSFYESFKNEKEWFKELVSFEKGINKEPKKATLPEILNIIDRMKGKGDVYK